MNEFFSPHPSTTSHMLGATHILSMIVCYSLIIFIGYSLRNVSPNKRRLIYKILAIITVTLDPIFWIWEFFAFGRFSMATSLPLYFCSIFILAAPMFAFTKPGSKINLLFRNYILTMNIVSAVLGLLFLIHLNRYPMFHFVVIRSFLYHYIMVLMPTIIYFGDKPKLKISDTFSFLLPASFIFIPALVVDLLYGFDYCYFHGGRGTPIFIFASRMDPILIFFLVLAFFLAVTNLFINLPRYLLYKKKRKLMEINFDESSKINQKIKNQ